MSHQVLIGDCLTSLRNMPDNSVHCCVTSPPYYGLRDYGVEGQIGLEPTPDEFVQALVAVFREVRRVLRDDGTLWLNIGDSYNNRTKVRSSSHQPALNGYSDDNWSERAKRGGVRMSINDGDLKEKDLIGIPWMLAFAMRRDGWYLRQEIVWDKTRGMPEPVHDRCTKGHESLFLLAKSKRYAVDMDALRVEGVPRRTVWSVPPSSFGKHSATFPPDLIEPCILAGSPVGGIVLDPFGGSGTTAGVAIAHDRNAILCELNPEYAALAPARIESIVSASKKAKKVAASKSAENQKNQLDIFQQVAP